MRFVVILTTLMLALGAAGDESLGQYGLDDSYVSNTPTLSFLDLSRLSLSHSYSLCYSSANGGRSIGMWMSSAEYRLSGSAEVRVDLGVLHRPSAFIGADNVSLDARVFPSVEFTYRPWRNFFLNVSYSTIPRTYAPSAWWDETGF
jgi:hypothetical protein